VKLRLLTDEDIGIVIGEPSEGDIMSLKQVAEFVEREAGVASRPEATAPASLAEAQRNDRQAAAASEALALRLLSRYHDARNAVGRYGGDVSALPAVLSFAEIDKRYTELMRDEVVDVPPDTISAELRYLDLIEIIIADRLLPHDAPVMSDGEDLNCALQMLKWVRSRANSRDIAEGLAEERLRRAAATASDA
jgi:hypothetical protein